MWKVEVGSKARESDEEAFCTRRARQKFQASVT
jgi:hypothetical protein